MADAALSLNVEAGSLPELAAATTKGHRWVEHLLGAVGLVTTFMSVALAIYKAPAGVFNGHGCAYYASVVTAGVVGLAEACAAVVWLSDGRWQGQGQQQQHLVHRFVLCASLLPLAFMAGLGGVRILVK